MFGYISVLPKVDAKRRNQRIYRNKKATTTKNDIRLKVWKVTG